VLEKAISIPISPQAELEFTDRRTEVNYLRPAPAPPAPRFAAGKNYPATAAALANGRLALRFGDSGIERCWVESRESSLQIAVESVQGASSSRWC